MKAWGNTQKLSPHDHFDCRSPIKANASGVGCGSASFYQVRHQSMYTYDCQFRSILPVVCTESERSYLLCFNIHSLRAKASSR